MLSFAQFLVSLDPFFVISIFWLVSIFVLIRHRLSFLLLVVLSFVFFRHGISILAFASSSQDQNPYYIFHIALSTIFLAAMSFGAELHGYLLSKGKLKIPLTFLTKLDSLGSSINYSGLYYPLLFASLFAIFLSFASYFLSISGAGGIFFYFSSLLSRTYLARGQYFLAIFPGIGQIPRALFGSRTMLLYFVLAPTFFIFNEFLNSNSLRKLLSRLLSLRISLRLFVGSITIGFFIIFSAFNIFLRSGSFASLQFFDTLSGAVFAPFAIDLSFQLLSDIDSRPIPYLYLLSPIFSRITFGFFDHLMGFDAYSSPALLGSTNFPDYQRIFAISFVGETRFSLGQGTGSDLVGEFVADNAFFEMIFFAFSLGLFLKFLDLAYKHSSWVRFISFSLIVSLLRISRNRFADLLFVPFTSTISFLIVSIVISLLPRKRSI